MNEGAGYEFSLHTFRTSPGFAQGLRAGIEGGTEGRRGEREEREGRHKRGSGGGWEGGEGGEAEGMASVTVIFGPYSRDQLTVKVTPATPMREVLDAVCTKLNRDPHACALQYVR